MIGVAQYINTFLSPLVPNFRAPTPCSRPQASPSSTAGPPPAPIIRARRPRSISARSLNHKPPRTDPAGSVLGGVVLLI
eukprot:COSAG06_NODE_1442_length_9453_cov_107.466859_3_plen_79_part_00